MSFKHRTKDGRVMELSEMTLDHLDNTIRLIENRAKSGVLVRSGGGTCPDDYWYDEDEVFGEEALEYLHYFDYMDERRRRMKKCT